MVQIIEENRRPTKSEQLGQALQMGSGMLKDYLETQKQQQGRQASSDFYRQLTGEELPENLPPEFQKMALDYGLAGKNKQQELSQNFQFDEDGYNAVKNEFGKKFADVWKAAPVGGRTDLLKHALDAAERGENVNDLLGNISLPEESEEVPQNVPQLKKGKVPADFNWPDFKKCPKGFTRKGWADEQKVWRKENAPIFEANKSKLSALTDDILATKKLNSLNDSGKLPEGMERLILNPETGEPYGIAQLAGTSPEVQEWVKTIAKFQNRAKDSFGSRVTNFDLVSYMKQFPGLLNTTEGRKRILNMMNVNYDMDSLYNKALDQIYKHYGLNGIPQEKADQLARGMIEKETEDLHTKYLGLDARNKEETGLSGRVHDVMGPDGQMYEIDERELDQLPEGFRLI